MFTYEPENFRDYSFKSSDGYLFKTEDEAIAYCDKANHFFAEMDKIHGVSESLSRSEYEEICTRLGIEMMSDEDCNSYGVKYGVFNFENYPAHTALKMTMAFKRLRALEKEAELTQREQTEKITDTARKERAAKFDQARISREAVLLRHWMAECDGSSGEDCSLDEMDEYAMPDGSTKISRSHCY